MHSATIKYFKTLELIHFQIKIPKGGQAKAKEGRMLPPAPPERNPGLVIIPGISNMFHNSWCESVHDEKDLQIYHYLPIYYRTRLIKILAAAVFANHSPRIYIQVSTWNHPGQLESVHSKNIALGNNFNTWYTCIWPLVWHNKYKLYNSSTPLQQFLTFLFTSQREKEAMKDERTYHGVIDKS